MDQKRRCLNIFNNAVISYNDERESRHSLYVQDSTIQYSEQDVNLPHSTRYGQFLINSTNRKEGCSSANRDFKYQTYGIG